MKLYATIQSERATKGQGGKYLNINIYNENKNLTYYINIDDGVLSLYKNNPLTNFDGLLLYKTKLKGKSQKGEKICSVIGCESKSKYHYQFEDLCEQHNKQS